VAFTFYWEKSWRKLRGILERNFANADLSVSDDAGVVALLAAKGYTVTPYTATGPTRGDDMRAAAVGQHPADFSNKFSFFGNTGRTEDTQPEDLKLPLTPLKEE
jgi:hypothetical protein